MTATFVFDGDCAFCSACARFVERRIPTPARVVPWQRADLAALRLTPQECTEAVQWVDGRAAAVAGPDAIARLLRSSNRLWRAAGWCLERRPVRAAAWPVYRWVAANRDRMPGGTPACAVPAREKG